MSGKYSAEWWKKFSNMDRERSAGQVCVHIVDDLIRATAKSRQRTGVKADISRSAAAGSKVQLSRPAHHRAAFSTQ
jgi:hypothetical protein